MNESTSSPSSTRFFVLALTVVALIQLSVPISMIWTREATLAQGTVYRFRTQPVDPYDAFRGRYVRLGFTQNQATVPDAFEHKPKDYVYVTLETDPEGFALLGKASKNRPDTDYLKLRGGRVHGRNITVTLPFNRFYMEEHKAPDAERLYQTRNGARPTYVTVAVRKGQGVIQDLFIDDLPVLEKLERLEQDPTG